MVGGCVRFFDIRKDSQAQRELEALVATLEGRVRRSFEEFIRGVKSDDVFREITRLLKEGLLEDALRIVDGYIARIGNSLPDLFVSAAEHEMTMLTSTLGAGAGHIAISFDRGNPRAAELMRAAQLQFIQEFTDEQRAVTRAALTDALSAGVNPREASLAFRDSIGLTTYQQGVVSNYRRLLEEGSAEALKRGLRDRRFDPTVRHAVQGEPLAAEQIDRMVDRYRARMLSLRAETIARTETARLQNLAREEAVRQTIEMVGMDESMVDRTWHSASDKRVRDTHKALNGQTVTGFSAVFVSPSGATLRYPGDPDAPIAETINCRCVVTLNIRKPPRRLEAA